MSIINVEIYRKNFGKKFIFVKNFILGMTDPIVLVVGLFQRIKAG